MSRHRFRLNLELDKLSMFHVRQVNDVSGGIGASGEGPELSEETSLKRALILGLLCRKK